MNIILQTSNIDIIIEEEKLHIDEQHKAYRKQQQQEKDAHQRYVQERGAYIKHFLSNGSLHAEKIMNTPSDIVTKLTKSDDWPYRRTLHHNVKPEEICGLSLFFEKSEKSALIRTLFLVRRSCVHTLEIHQTHHTQQLAPCSMEEKDFHQLPEGLWEKVFWKLLHHDDVVRLIVRALYEPKD